MSKKNRFIIIKNGLIFLLAFTSFEAFSRGADENCPELDSITNGQPAIQVFETSQAQTITSIDPGWFNIEGSANAPIFYQILIREDLRPRADSGQLKLWIFVRAVPKKRVGSKVGYIIVDALFKVEPKHVGSLISSADVTQMEAWEGGENGLDGEVDELMGASDGRIPSMDLESRFILSCGSNRVTEFRRIHTNELGSGDRELKLTSQDLISGDGFGSELRNVENIQIGDPGTDISNPSPIDIFTQSPTFRIISDLYNEDFKYGNEPKFTIFLFELEEGESPQDGLDGLEYMSINVHDVNPPPVQYPASAPPLRVGKTYVWRARANLVGPTTTYIYSGAKYFRISPILDGGGLNAPDEFVSSKTFERFVSVGDDYNRRLFAALKIVLGENYDLFISNLGKKLPIKGHIRWNGQPYTLDQFERLAKEFLKDKHSLTRVRFQ